VHIYCDESGGVGRGVMTLAALSITEMEAEAIIHRFRAVTGISGEIKGSRIDLGERALLFELLEKSHATATVGVALSVTRPAPGEDRGDHDVQIYTALLEDVLGAIIPTMPACNAVVIDDGRYSDATLADIRTRVGKLVGPFGTAQLELSHRAAGLQLADIIANTFFTRALPGDRQGRMSAIATPLMASGRLTMRVLMRQPQREHERPE
jgi:hypothetical protein